MKARLSVMFLILVSILPRLIELYKFDLRWAMKWGNESNAWNSIFLVFTFVGVLIAYKNRKDQLQLLFLSVFLTVIISGSSAYSILKQGVGPSSNEDGNELNLVDYWRNGVWE